MATIVHSPDTALKMMKEGLEWRIRGDIKKLVMDKIVDEVDAIVSKEVSKITIDHMNHFCEDYATMSGDAIHVYLNKEKLDG